MREMISQNNDLRKKIEALEKKFQDHDERIREIFFTLKKLMEPFFLFENPIYVSKIHGRNFDV